MSKKSEAYKEGYKAGLEGGNENDNPYRDGTRNAWDWEYGLEDGLDKRWTDQGNDYSGVMQRVK